MTRDGPRNRSHASLSGGAYVPKEPAARVITPFMFQGRFFASAGKGAGRGMPCGQYASGRLVHTWTSVTVPMAPDWMYSLTRRASSEECPWLPICVCSLLDVARAASRRHSSTDHARGFCTY